MKKKSKNKLHSKSKKTKNLSGPAHSPGHRNLNLLKNFPEHTSQKIHMQESAVNQIAADDKLKRANSKNRRIITGATIGNKTGKIIYK